LVDEFIYENYAGSEFKKSAEESFIIEAKELTESDYHNIYRKVRAKLLLKEKEKIHE